MCIRDSSGTSWLVIRHPDQLTAPAWISAASLVNSGDPTKLPELTCSTALTLAAIVPTAATTPAATATGVPTATPTGTAVPTAPTSTSPTTSSSSTSKSSTDVYKRQIQILGMLATGDLDQAREAAEAAYAAAQLSPSQQARAWAAMLVGLVTEVTGDVTACVRALAEAERLWSTVRVWGFAVWCGAALARAQAESGDLDEAAVTLQRVEGFPRPPQMLCGHLLDLARAWVAFGTGDRAGAAAHVCLLYTSRLRRGGWRHARRAHRRCRSALGDRRWSGDRGIPPRA